MIHSNDYWFYDSALSNEECQSLLNLKRQYQLETATIDEGDIDSKVRKTEVLFTSEEWVYDLIRPYLEDALVNANWNFDIDWCEPAQFTEYKHGGHYSWHIDSMPLEKQEKLNISYKGKIRKLSTTVVLSDSNEYEGADFEMIHSPSLSPNENKKINIMKEPGFRNKGTIIFFPSDVWHRVTPITSGVRNSIVFWWLGPTFR